VLLQAPGVVQEAQGDLHVRGDHRNLQYRINGVIIPEAISGFGQLFDARGMRSVELITGALPAQFGYRTAGIVDITLRSGAQDPGGTASLYGGSFGQFQPSLAYGSAGRALRILRDRQLPAQRPRLREPDQLARLHPQQHEQVRGLVNMAICWTTGRGWPSSAAPTSRASRSPTSRAAGAIHRLRPEQLRQREPARAAVAALQLRRAGPAALARRAGRAALHLPRQTSISYVPDTVGEVVLSGVGAETRKRNYSAGLQGDASWRLVEAHTLRGGFFASGDITRNIANSTVLPLNAQGVAFDAPFTIQERAASRASSTAYTRRTSGGSPTSSRSTSAGAST